MFALLFILAAFVVAQSNAWPAKGNYYLGLRVLVVYDDDYDLTIPRLVLEGFNTQWDKITSQALDLNQPKYSAIVISSHNIGEVAMTAVRDYAAQYNVRVVHLNSSPNNVPQVSATKSPSNGEYIVFDDSPDAINVGDILNTKTGWQVPSVLNPWTAQKLKGAVQPILRYSDFQERSSDGDIAAFVGTNDKVEEMFFLFDTTRHEMEHDYFTGRDNPLFNRDYDFTETHLALGTMWFVWATRGLFTGLRRLHMNTHVDDYLIASPVYNTDKVLRIDGRSCEGNVAVSKQITASMPEGSLFVFENALNGIGYKQNDYEKQQMGVGLVACSEKHLEDYFWVSHTYAHKDFDWKDADECNGMASKCLETYERNYQEIRLNQQIINGEEVDPTVVPKYSWSGKIEAGGFFGQNEAAKAKHFSPLSLVPPEISGIVPLNFKIWPGWDQSHRVYGRPFNTDATRAIKDNGIKYLTGDNTRAELMSSNNHHGLYMTKERWGVDDILILNRRASAVDFTAETPERFLESTGGNAICETVAGMPCNKFKLSFENSLDREVLSHLAYYLQYNPDPIMFHQNNLNLFEHKGKSTSLVGMWAERMAVHIMSYFTGHPIVSLKMDDLGNFVEKRMQRDDCDIRAELVVENGVAQGVHVVSSNSCEAKLTLVKGTAPFTIDPSHVKQTETYGRDETVTLAVSSSSSAWLSVKGALF